jgi:hypothetical protein
MLHFDRGSRYGGKAAILCGDAVVSGNVQLALSIEKPNASSIPRWVTWLGQSPFNSAQ